MFWDSKIKVAKQFTCSNSFLKYLLTLTSASSIQQERFPEKLFTKAIAVKAVPKYTIILMIHSFQTNIPITGSGFMTFSGGIEMEHWPRIG